MLSIDEIRFGRVRPTMLLVFSFGMLLFVAACESPDDPPDVPENGLLAEPGTTESQAGAAFEVNLLEVLRRDDRFSQFVQAIEQADVVSILESPGPFTVFAPIDEAFAEVVSGEEDSDNLRDLVMNHISDDMQIDLTVYEISTVNTLYGDDLVIRTTPEGEVMVEEARVVESGIETGNGIIHAIEGVLRPAMSEEAGDL
ncbi:MAG: fasciclin domain-containing protein [Bacteroidota bacterium]